MTTLTPNFLAKSTTIRSRRWSTRINSDSRSDSRSQATRSFAQLLRYGGLCTDDLRHQPNVIFGESNLSSSSSSLKFVSDDGVKLSRNMCIYYNNFEVASFSLFRNATYLSYFDYFDLKGGFYYERWSFRNFNNFS